MAQTRPIYRHIDFPMRMVGLDKAERKRRIENAASILNLTDYLDRRPGQLSGGQRQRVAIGRAIVREPSAFLFDEPLSNLDAALRVGMRMEISELHNRLKTTMVYVTHDQVEAMTMADKIVVLNAGRIEQVGSPLDLYKAPQNLFVAGFIGSPKMNFITGEAAAQHDAVTIGIRPEHIAVSESQGVWSGVIGVSEHLGSDTFFHVHDTGLAEKITVRVDGEVGLRSNRRVASSDLMITLSNSTLGDLPNSVDRPTYDRSTLHAGIVHIGVGNFHRAHQAWYTHRLMQQGRAMDWAIVGAGVRPADAAMREKLLAQDCLTTLIELAPDERSAELTGAMIDYRLSVQWPTHPFGSCR